MIGSHSSEKEGEWISENLESLQSIYIEHWNSRGPGVLLINSNQKLRNGYPILYYTLPLFNELCNESLRIDNPDFNNQLVLVILGPGGTRRTHIVGIERV